MRAVPKQNEGGKSDNSSEQICNTIPEAKIRYYLSCKNLLSINDWANLCKNLLHANFKLFNEQGQPVDGRPREGHFIRIDVPGPGSVTGDGFDWVQIEKLAITKESEEDEFLSMTVRPASSPLNDKNDTAHFFSEEATSTFIVKRSGKAVIAEIHGRNEKPNDDTESTIDTVRNKVVANLAMARFSDIQWKELCKGLLSTDPESL